MCVFCTLATTDNDGYSVLFLPDLTDEKAYVDFTLLTCFYVWCLKHGVCRNIYGTCNLGLRVILLHQGSFSFI